MRYRADLKRTLNDRWYARCNVAPQGLAEAWGDSPDEALEMLRKEIRYRLELRPCSSLGDQNVWLDVRERVTSR